MKQWKRTLWVVAAFLVLLGVGCSSEQGQADRQTGDQSAQANQPGQGMRMQCEDRFTSLDANKDGVVTQEEFNAFSHPGGHAEEVFRSRDADGNGNLTQEEFCSGRGMGQGKRQ